VEDGRAVSVRQGSAHEYPEAPVEMSQAIAIARGTRELRDKVQNLA
jgi:hypothetical protein